MYFNISVAGAAALVSVCTRVLNRAGIPFDLKVVDDPDGFDRCDAAVLYLADRDFASARESLRTIVSTCCDHLHGEPPAFTKPLSRGVSVGEHRPTLGASFGTSRCRFVAEGVVAAYESGARDLPDRLDAVVRRFADHRVDIDLPYLAPGSTDRYEL